MHSRSKAISIKVHNQKNVLNIPQKRNSKNELSIDTGSLSNETVRDLKNIYGDPLPNVLASPSSKLPDTEISPERFTEEEDFTFASENTRNPTLSSK